MKSVSVDTCVVLRILVREPIAQARKAKVFLQDAFLQGTRVCVSDLVVAESFHALIHHYDVPEAKAVGALKSFLESSVIFPTGNALTVLSSYKNTGAGFVDRLIRMEALSSSSQLMTFDKKLARLENVSLL